jgi:hypothetical protein
MKKIVLFLAITFAVAGCQKELHFETAPSPANENNAGDNAGSEYYMTLKLDGNPRRFTFSNVALLSDLGTGGKNLTFIGLAQPSNVSMEGLHLSVYFLRGAPTTGTFQQGDHTGDHALSGDYNANSAQFGYFAGVHSPSIAPLKITISSITNSVVKGSFSGAFYKKDLNGTPGTINEYVLITEGAFNLPIK